MTPLALLGRLAAAALLAISVIPHDVALAQELAPPLQATIFFKNPPPGVVFDPTTPITIVLQLQNVSGAPVTTTEGFSATDFWRRLFFTDPVGGIIADRDEASVHRSVAVGFCFSRQRVLLRPHALPVVPIEVLAGPSSSLAAPAAPTLTPSPSGGSLPTATYYYRITAFDAGGIETNASPEVSVFVTGPTGSVAVSWPAVMGATSYRVYRGITPGRQDTYYPASTNSLLDTGAAGRFGYPLSPWTIEYVVPDAKQQFGLTQEGSYTVEAKIPVLTFALSDPNAVIRDCDQFATDVANVGAGAVAGRRSFTILSNRLSFSLLNTPIRTPPTISAIDDQATAEDTPTRPISFTVGDQQTSPAQLTVTGKSSDPFLVPDSNIVFSTVDPTLRTVTVTPALNQTGMTTITLTVTDGDGSTAHESFTLTVTPVNDQPSISDIPDQQTATNTATTPIPFTIADVDNPATSLILSGKSSNTTLVPNANIVFGGSGTNRTVTITPAADQSGTATITITVSDGALTASDSFVLTVSATPVKAKEKVKGGS